MSKRWDEQIGKYESKYSEFKKTLEHEEWNFGSRKKWYRCNLRLKNKPVGMPVDKSLKS